MNKVHVTKSESAASVIGKVLDMSDKEVIIYVPRVSKFAKSRSSFLLLKREARAAGKDVTIESVDDDVLELAANSGLRSVNPFRGKRQRAVSDMVSVSTAIDIDSTKIADETDKEPLKIRGMGVKEKKDRWRKWKKAKLDKSKIISIDDTPKEVFYNTPDELMSEPGVVEQTVEKGPIPDNLKRFLIAVGITVVLTAILTIVLVALPRVNIALNFEKVDWDFVGQLSVSANTKENRFSGDEIRLKGVSFLEKKNMTKSYPASGQEFVERKAKGVLTVYNAYSSDPQDLVENTRFRTPDGKVYKTDKYITIPGADIVDGKIVPSSTDVPVTASEVGEEYNIGPVTKYRIPGFQDSPKYDGFYGESKDSMTGGVAGERRIPTEEDIASAKEDIAKILEEATRSQLFLNLPPEIKVLDGAYKFKITDETIDDTTGGTDKFNITVYGEGRLIGCDENDLIGVIKSRVEDEAKIDLVIRDYSAEYDTPQVSDDGMGFKTALSLKSVWAQPFDMAQFKKDAAGKNETELKSLIFAVPGVKSGEVRFWPFWVNKVPEKERKIIVDVQ